MTVRKTEFENVTLVDHPLIKRDLTILRDKNTPSLKFRSALARVSTILAYHALEDLSVHKKRVDTPIQATVGYSIATKIIVVPILRAGLGLVDSILHFIPDASVGHVGLYRDETTKKPVQYYYKMPAGLADSEVIMVDPMLATGGSALAALDILKKKGAVNLRFMCLISAPEGLSKLEEMHPDVPVITAAIDEKLNDNAFIVPGLGDAGDRFFGTE